MCENNVYQKSVCTRGILAGGSLLTGGAPGEPRGSAGEAPGEARGSPGGEPGESRGSPGGVPGESRGRAGGGPGDDDDVFVTK